MLIINADDWGYNSAATDRILSCYERERINSTSAMVFMSDSQRAADLALNGGIEVGLHLNFTDLFTGDNLTPLLTDYQHRIASYLRKKYCLVIYNPFLRKHFEYVFRAQYEEFVRLYGKVPAHVNGHRHMHLCTNVLIDGLIFPHEKVRRSFSFFAGEKPKFNRLYRRFLDIWVKRRYVCTDYFFSIAPIEDRARLRRIISFSQPYNVELMVHPQMVDEYEYLIGDEYMTMLRGVQIGTFSAL
jgi:chitin disaccharide deacetylase